jgi:Glyoxalase-like domain
VGQSVAVTVQVAFDAHDPQASAEFWAAATGYVVQPPPDGFDSWQAFLTQIGVPEEQWDKASACIDPDGQGPRFYFQKVPESKVVKNRVHLDLKPGLGHDPAERRAVVLAEVQRLHGLGARTLGEHDESGEFWIVLADPEGNEFCVS